MKRILKLELPIAFILFNLITKWWSMSQVDGPNRIFYGFPLRFKTRSIATSMRDEYFLLEMIFDLIVYFLVVLLFSSFFIKNTVSLNGWIPVCLYIIGSVFFVLSNGLMLIGDYDIYSIFNDNGFAISELDSGLYWFYYHSY